MASPSYNTTYELSERTIILWGQEKVAAGTVAAAFTKEEFGTFSYAPNRNIFVPNFRAGFPSRRYNTQETWHFADVTLNVPFHPGGLAGYFLVDILGDVTNVGTADVKSGAGDPYTHTVTPGVNGTRCVTFSVVFASLMDGGAVPALEFLYCTPKSIKLSGTSGSPLMAELQFTGYWPAPVALPSGSWNTPSTYTFGYQSNHTVVNSAGSTLSAQITDADITISRQVTAQPSYNNAGSQNPIDIIPLDLSFQANLSLYYDGMATTPTTKHYSEYLAYLKSGISGTPDKFKWADANSPGHSVEIDAWPCAWSVDNINTTEGLMTCQATLDAEQDFGQATAGSPAMTTITTAILKNNVATVMAI